jgi:hypothetical protein
LVQHHGSAKRFVDNTGAIMRSRLGVALWAVGVSVLLSAPARADQIALTSGLIDLTVTSNRGIDLRLMEGEDFQRTQLLRDGPAAQQRAEEWR